jgi:hypothetical protein
MQVDPLGFGAGDNNLYRDEEDSPTVYLDPSGLEPPGQTKPGRPSASTGEIKPGGPGGSPGQLKPSGPNASKLNFGTGAKIPPGQGKGYRESKQTTDFDYWPVGEGSNNPGLVLKPPNEGGAHYLEFGGKGNLKGWHMQRPGGKNVPTNEISQIAPLYPGRKLYFQWDSTNKEYQGRYLGGTGPNGKGGFQPPKGAKIWKGAKAPPEGFTFWEVEINQGTRLWFAGHTDETAGGHYLGQAGPNQRPADNEVIVTAPSAGRYKPKGKIE